MQIEHLNPSDNYDTLKSRGFTQVVTATGFSKLIVISGQMPLDIRNNLVGRGDIEAQARACYANLQRSLAAAGADVSHVLRMTTYVTDLKAHAAGVRRARADVFGSTTPPASTMIEVPKFLNDMLIEVEALAVI